MRRLIAGLLLGWMVAVSAGDAMAQPASAQPAAGDVAAARDLYREGAKAAKAGKWEEARDKFQRSYTLRPSALTRYSLAMAQKETGHLVDALESFRAFLRDPMDASTNQYRPLAEAAIPELEGKIAWTVVKVSSAPANLEVKLDGVVLAAAAIGVRRPVDPGHHKVEARAEGFQPFTKEFDVASAGNAEIAISLVAIPRAALTASAPASTERPAAPPVAPEQPSGNKGLGTVLAISGGTLFVGGVVVGLLGVSKAKSAETSDGSDASSAKSLALVGDIVGGVGLITAGIGTYLLLSSGSKEAQPAANARKTLVSPWMGSHSGGVSVVGLF